MERAPPTHLSRDGTKATGETAGEGNKTKTNISEMTPEVIQFVDIFYISSSTVSVLAAVQS